MPGKYNGRISKRYRRGRKTYVPQELRLSRVQRPYASKYGDECFVKVQKVVPLITQNQDGDVFAIMRQDIPASDVANFVPFDQPEFVGFLPLYSFYEIRGMKAEMTVADTARISGSGMFAGMAPGVAQPIVNTPVNDALVKLPIQTQGNTQGQMFSIYYAYSDDLKKQGAQFALPTNSPVPNGNAGIIIARVQLVTAPPAAGTKVGEVKFTWYIRLTARKYIV